MFITPSIICVFFRIENNKAVITGNPGIFFFFSWLLFYIFCYVKSQFWSASYTTYNELDEQLPLQPKSWPEYSFVWQTDNMILDWT